MTGERLSDAEIVAIEKLVGNVHLSYETIRRLIADLRAERAETARLREVAREVLDFWDDYATTREPGRVALRAALAEVQG